MYKFGECRVEKPYGKGSEFGCCRNCVKGWPFQTLELADFQSSTRFFNLEKFLEGLFGRFEGLFWSWSRSTEK